MRQVADDARPDGVVVAKAACRAHDGGHQRADVVVVGRQQIELVASRSQASLLTLNLVAGLDVLEIVGASVVKQSTVVGQVDDTWRRAVLLQPNARRVPYGRLVFGINRIRRLSFAGGVTKATESAIIRLDYRRVI